MSEPVRVLDSDELWRRVGLAELRQALVRTEELLVRFEQTLQTLPPCTKCAHSQVLGQLETETAGLSREMTGLAALAHAIRESAVALERTHAQLRRDAPAPCQCRAGTCTCHDD